MVAIISKQSAVCVAILSQSWSGYAPEASEASFPRMASSDTTMLASNATERHRIHRVGIIAGLWDVGRAGSTDTSLGMWAELPLDISFA